MARRLVSRLSYQLRPTCENGNIIAESLSQSRIIYAQRKVTQDLVLYEPTSEELNLSRKSTQVSLRAPMYGVVNKTLS